MDDQIRSTVRLNADFQEQVRIAIAKRRLRSFQAAVEQALKLWLAEGSSGAIGSKSESPAPPPSPATEWHRKLSEILASGDEAAIAAVKSHLDLIHARLRPSGRKRKAG